MHHRECTFGALHAGESTLVGAEFARATAWTIRPGWVGDERAALSAVQFRAIADDEISIGVCGGESGTHGGRSIRMPHWEILTQAERHAATVIAAAKSGDFGHSVQFYHAAKQMSNRDPPLLSRISVSYYRE